MESNTHNLSRRGFLAKSGVATLAGLSASQVQASPTERPPNILMVVCDQMRGDAMGCVGHPNAQTPNLDAMAKAGTLCTHAFSNNPVCIPSRVSMFTGRYPHEHGTLSNQGVQLDSQKNTMLEWFRAQGYRMGWVGKNHTFEKAAFRGVEKYDELKREPFRTYKDPKVTPWWHGDMAWPAGQCYGAQNTDNATKFLEGAKKDEPFFLTVNYFDPHPPYFAPAEDFAKQLEKKMDLPDYVDPGKLSPRLDAHQRAYYYDTMSDAELRMTMRYYHASVAYGVDQQMGRLLAVLQKQGLAEDTVVVFVSDHGDFMGHHHMVRKSMFLYDSLLHVPMIWYAPGRIPAGQRMTGMAQLVDLFPTFVDFCGGEKPAYCSGDSLKSALEGKSALKDRTIIASAGYAELPENYFDAPEPLEEAKPKTRLHKRVGDAAGIEKNKTIMARTKDWKFILNETRGPELYKLDGDTVERENVVGKPEHQSVRKELEAVVRQAWTW